MADLAGDIVTGLLAAVLAVGVVIIAANEPHVVAFMIDRIGTPLLRLLQRAGIVKEPVVPANTPGHVLHITRVGYEYVCECGDWRWRPAPSTLTSMLVFAQVEAEAHRRHAEHVRLVAANA